MTIKVFNDINNLVKRSIKTYLTDLYHFKTLITCVLLKLDNRKEFKVWNHILKNSVKLV